MSRPRSIGFGSLVRTAKLAALLLAAGASLPALTQPIGYQGELNVGIGIAAPTTKLQVAGIIQSTTGGIRFPDGSIQITVKLTGPQGPSGPQGAQAHPARKRRRGQHMGE